MSVARRRVGDRKVNHDEREVREEARAYIEVFDALNRLGYSQQRRVLRSYLDRLDFKIESLKREA